MAVTSAYRLSDRYVAERGTVFLTGIQALARLPVDQLLADRRAGLRTAGFISGYPGSPLGGYDRAVATAAKSAGDLPIVVRPALNEEYAATAVMGSQLANARPDARYDGVVGIWYGKAPGVDRASDALRHAAFAGSWWRGGAVALVGDDPSAKSSTVPSSSAASLADMNLPLLYPADPAEALDLGRHAIALSRATGLWSALKIVADVADATATVELDPDRVRPIIPLLDNGLPYQRRPEGRLLTPLTLDLEREIVEIRQPLAVRYAADNRLNFCPVDPPDAWIGIAASGITYREVREALGRLGLHDDAQIAACGIRLFKLRMPLPFDPATVHTFARGVREILVIEEKQPNVETLIKEALYPLAERPVVVGKRDETGAILVPGHGAFDADAIIPVLRRRLGAVLGDRLLPEAPAGRERLGRLTIPATPFIPPAAAATTSATATGSSAPGDLSAAGSSTPGSSAAASPAGDEVQRAPFYCSGCPHNRSTEVPEGTVVGAGIGCHTMTLLMDPTRVGDIVGLTVMGNEGTQWIGMSEFVETPHIVQNLGDGTFFHSGQLAIQAAVASGVNITYKLLHNGAVAMTGGQQPQGKIELPAIVRTLLDHGVVRVLVTTDDLDRDIYRELPKSVEVWHRDRLIEAQQLLATVPGVTVLVHDQPCAAEARRARKRGLVPTPTKRIVINQRVCEGCGDCGRTSNCLSVQPVDTPFGRKTAIDQTTCNLDYSCIEGDCPSFMSVSLKPTRTGRLAHRARRRRADGPTTGSRARVTPAPPSTFPSPLAVVPVDDFGVRITGIGGTGVVTVAQVLGTAAMLDGFHARGLDQIGLSQKAGPVVSDLRLSRHGDADTSRLGGGQADLLLAFDLLVAASEKGLNISAPDRTVVVGSTSATPVGSMIAHPEQTMPGAAVLIERISERTRDVRHFADADAIAADLFGDTSNANMLVVGMAVQAGCLPIDPTRVEEAITLNSVAVAANTAAFRWGRCLIANPAAVESARATDRRSPTSPGEPSLPAALAQQVAALPPSLRPLLRRLADDLRGYADDACASSFLSEVAAVHARESVAVPESTAMTEAVAVHLHKLIAYKDEYEVARLLTAPDALVEARALAGRGGKVCWHLHPPVLRALGMDRKLALPTWTAPGFRLLARGKRFRGSVLDPFRYGAVRRAERSLPDEYLAAIHRVLPRLTTERLAEAVELARLPDQVRGYEHLKLDRITSFRTALTEALTRW